MLLVLDNYDSFTFNLVQYLGELAADYPLAGDLRVIRNDALTLEAIKELNPGAILISPGPGDPDQSGICLDVLREISPTVPTLGVCLGHQSIGQQFGMIVERNSKLMHGKTSPIHHDGKGLFVGMSNPFIATRYHSLIVNKDSFNSDKFEVTAWTDEGEIMGLRSKADAFEGDAPMEGVQFHPESFMTTEGPILLANFLGLPRPNIEALA